MSIVTHKNIGGRIARTLLPITLVIPVIFGWMYLQGQFREIFSLQFGTALLIISIMLVFTVLIWGLAWSINRTDDKRQKAEIAAMIAKQEAEDAKKIQEQFLANMSHELRTPINGVIGLTQLIGTTTLTKDQKEYVDMVKESAAHLLVIVNDILDTTKIKAGKIVLENIQFSLYHKVRSLIRLFRLQAARKKILLNYYIAPEVPDYISGDFVRLNQVLTNLINNALKFTPKAGEINLHISVGEEDAASTTIRFEVNDTGIGIPENKLESIFDSFTQASVDTTRKFGGTGLGLTISKQLVELQGGHINVTSTPGKGSSFIFQIPFKKAAQELIQTGGELPDYPRLDQLHILLAEDNPVNQKLTSVLLEKEGATVEVANNGTEVLAMLGKNKYDVILMDINMPEMDGFETTESIRNTESPYQFVPIIALTASAFDTEREKCIELGMNDYLSKPFKAAELLSKIKKHFSKMS